MMMAFTYLPAFVTAYFQSMPGVWKSHHRLMLCWLIFMQAINPRRNTLQEMCRWTPASITAWRFSRLLKATYWNVHLLVSWMAQDLIATLPPPSNRILYLIGDGSQGMSEDWPQTNAGPRIQWLRKAEKANITPGFSVSASCC
jgi:hypothetical protein